MLAVQARCGVCVVGDRGDGGAVPVMAVVRQGSVRKDGSPLVDQGDSDWICTASQRTWNGIGIKICEEASIKGREHLPVDVLDGGVRGQELAGVYRCG